jgi:hypothetical protein
MFFLAEETGHAYILQARNFAHKSIAFGGRFPCGLPKAILTSDTLRLNQNQDGISANEKPSTGWVLHWQGRQDLNLRHPVLETGALPTELLPWVLHWQGRQDLNLRHPVLETGALPTELLPYQQVLY